ncbi:MAG TPA: ATP-binding protein [Candidatus Omnitrophota bacterium]|nr:ATP-binding protein [Candidatus Omnitrophota bacterium]
MKQITVISGKGGTGKTALSASFAALAENKVTVDCDVDAANLHLLLQPDIRQKREFKGGMKARTDPNRCSRCGLCRDVCKFEAVSEDFRIDLTDCEGCGLCVRVCPEKAIEMIEIVSGEWFVSETRYGPFVHAKLGVAEGNSGKLVAVIREAAREMAEKQNREFVIIDGPPGIGCPVIASLSGADLAVVVTEPTLSGIHDMKRVLSLACHFGIPAGIVVNKYDLNSENTGAIESFSKEHGLEVIGRIPFSPEVSRAIVQGVPPVEFCRDGVRTEIISIWEKLQRSLRS